MIDMDNNIDRYMRQMENIDAEYQKKIDKIRKEWGEQLNVYWNLIDKEREKLGLIKKESK